MKKIVGAGLLLALVLFLIPMGIRQDRLSEGSRSLPGGGESAVLPESGHTLSVLLPDGTVEEMDVNTYLWGVVAAEMPATFETEALKAQAVAARTFSLKKASSSTAAHPEADICTDFACCQAWIAREEAEANWGASAAENAARITAAVAGTGDQVILYDGALIEAVFHSSSGAATQDAAEVWGGSVPYLKSVSSPEGEETPDYQSQRVFSAQEFRDVLLAARPEADLSGDPTDWVGPLVYNDSGSVRAMPVGGLELSGTQARSIFGLRSACFSVEIQGDAVTFYVTGFGHGVGMSQYGANAMAKAGSTWQEILAHYYTGVTIAPCPAELWPDGGEEGAA